jgi:hypothetical protein
MSSRWCLPVVLVVVATLAYVATPPVIENHLEAGFCSADCPVQLTGHGSAITPPAPPTAADRAPVVVAATIAGAVRSVAIVSLPDAPRAPPSRPFA